MRCWEPSSPHSLLVFAGARLKDVKRVSDGFRFCLNLVDHVRARVFFSDGKLESAERKFLSLQLSLSVESLRFSRIR